MNDPIHSDGQEQPQVDNMCLWSQQVSQWPALQQNRLLLSAINNINGGVFITDATHHDNPIIFVNQAFTTITGYEPEEILGHNYRLLQGVDTDPLIVRQMREALAARRSYSATLLNYRKDGTTFWNELTITPIFDESGRVLNFIGVQQDVTEKKRLEDAVHNDELGLRALVSSIDEVVFEFDREGTYVNVLTNNEALLAQPRQQLLGRPISDVLGEEVAQPFIEAFRLIIASGQAQGMDYSLELEDGQHWFHARMSPILAPDGSCQTVCMLTRDITEKKRTETELSQSEEKFRSLVSNIPGVIYRCAVNQNWSMEFISERIEELSGYPASDFIADKQRSYASIVHPQDREMLEEQVAQAVKARAPFILEYRIVHADGTVRWVYEQGRVIVASDKSPYIDGAIFDITARKRDEVALQQAKEAAEHADHAKSEFLSRMSHELRTPLNAILGFGQVLQRQDLAPGQQESISYILKGGRHLLGLINEVLDIARVEAGHIELSIESISVVDVVSECCALMRPLAQQRDMLLVDDALKSASLYVMADQQRLKQVLLNLLSNAIKYNSPAGEVTISIRLVDNHRLQLRVRDSGPGLSTQDLAKLFTPFERLQASDRQIEGTGLGLALSKRLVTIMGGELGVESHLGEGSTFWVEFPQANSPVEALAKLPLKQPEALREVVRTYTILSVEDNSSNTRLLETILMIRPEFTLLTAIDGLLGLDLARQRHPDLILLDLNLPGLSGSEVLQRLRESQETQGIPVIIISADATPAQIERLLSSGARAYLTKPLNVDEFLNLVDKVLATDKES